MVYVSLEGNLEKIKEDIQGQANIILNETLFSQEEEDSIFSINENLQIAKLKLSEAEYEYKELLKSRQKG